MSDGEPRARDAGRFLDLEAWPRAATFRFFRGHEQPFFNVCAPVDVGRTLALCRASGRSFSLAAWFLCLRAADAVEPLRYRLRGERVWVHDALDVGVTVLRDDETFRFCYLRRADTFDAFAAGAARAIAAVRAAPADAPQGEEGRDDVLHGTVLPWLAFTSISHARRVPAADSVPKVAFGKYERRGERVDLPVSIEVHHALVDGLHVGRFHERLAALHAAPEAALSGP